MHRYIHLIPLLYPHETKGNDGISKHHTRIARMSQYTCRSAAEQFNRDIPLATVSEISKANYFAP